MPPGMHFWNCPAVPHWHPQCRQKSSHCPHPGEQRETETEHGCVELLSTHQPQLPMEWAPHKFRPAQCPWCPERALPCGEHLLWLFLLTPGSSFLPHYLLGDVFTAASITTASKEVRKLPKTEFPSQLCHFAFAFQLFS